MTPGRLGQTAPWTRWLQLALLALFAAFQLASFVSSRAGRAWLTTLMAPVDRLAYWHFFTVARSEHVALRFEGLDGDAWRELPMSEWFAARWESGPRWNALGFGRDVGLPPLSGEDRVASEQAFLEAACRRSRLQRTRLVQLVWPKRLGPAPTRGGAVEPPPSAAKTRVLAIRKCNE